MSNASSLQSSTSLPVIVAPMFLVSTPALALAACAEGLVGSFPALNCRTSADLDVWLQKMNDGLDALRRTTQGKIAPYAVNLIVKGNPRLQEDLELCVKHKVPVIITSLGLSQEVIDKVHAYGGKVLHDVASVDHARKAAAAGVDGLIAVAAGAGGHAGTLNPHAMVSEIRGFYDGLLVLAGCLGRGNDILSAQAMGADFAYMGTRFIATAECQADPAYKQMIVEASSADIVYTPAISGIPANFLRKSIEKAGFTPEQLKQAQPGKLKSMAEEAKAWKNIWSAGQGAGSISDVPTVKELVARLRREYQAALQDLNKKNTPPQP